MKIRKRYILTSLVIVSVVTAGVYVWQRCHQWAEGEAGRGPMDPPKVAFSTSGPVPAVAYSPDGRHLAAATSKGVVIWDRLTARPWRTLAGPTGSLAYSPDGTLLATSGSDGVALWDVERGERRHTFPVGNPHWIARDISFGFSPDGRTLAVVAHDGGRLCDVTTGKVTQGFSGNHSAAAFSPDGKLLATTTLDSVELWDTATSERRQTHPQRGRGSASQIDRVFFAPGGGALIYGGPFFNDLDVATVWEPASGKERGIAGAGRTSSEWGWVSCMALSPDGRTLATGEFTKGSRRSGCRIRLFDVPTGELLRVIWHRRAFDALAFSPDGTEFAAGCGEDYGPSRNDDRGVCIWDVQVR